ncbi:hypothetical protein CGZ80_05690 [Rhodopirellula sp. MGV]|nr:hypothetical protein CGZ80_05690 [Rhodopirellula sp. MGV]PNY38065.1 VWA domain-containing protein [Rhodopirellula baltica]
MVCGRWERHAAALVTFDADRAGSFPAGTNLGQSFLWTTSRVALHGGRDRRSDGMTQFSIEPIYASTWLVVFAAVAIVGVIAWVAPPTTDPRKRRWLILLRSIAALVLLLAAVRPTIIRTDQRPSPATLVIAIDDSKSMSLPDGDGASRWDTQREAVQQLLDGLGNFDEAMDIELIRYDETSQSIGQATSVDQVASLKQSLSSQNPSGNTTDLGMAFSGAIDLTASKTLAGVVLIGDGMQTSRQAGPAAGSSGTSSPSNDSAGPLNARYGAQVLDALGVPLWTIPVGPPNTGAASRDVAVSNLPDSMQLFSGNQFELSFTVETLGLSGLQVPIQVTWIDEAGGREVSRTRTLDPSSARESMALDIPMVAPKPGVYRLEVEAERQDGEWVTSNNVQTAFVEVREGGGRILILEGPGRPELAFLRRSLRGFPDLDLQFATIRGDQSWPVQLEAALQPKRFDVLVIGDVDSSAFGDAQLKLIADRVSEGTGLITLGGLSSYSVGGYAGGPLDPVLPVKLDSSRRRQPPARQCRLPKGKPDCKTS